MMIKKYLLVVDAPDGEVAREAPALKSDHYDVAFVSNLEAALGAIARLERLSLVIVNCQTHVEHYESFMAAVRGLHPHLPVIWVADSTNVVAKFLRPSLSVSKASDLRGLRDKAGKVLRDRLYGNDLVRDLMQATERALNEFGIDARCSDPYIKSNLTVLSEVNALLNFSGEGLSGYLILSASHENARTLYRQFSAGEGEPQYDELEDLLGEITNRVLGRAKEVFEARALPCKLDTPSFIRGSDAYFRSAGSSPSLAVEFGAKDALLLVEFCINRMDAKPAFSSEDVQFLETGEITFL